MNMKRHYGALESGARVIVVFMSLPEQQDHALVVETARQQHLVVDELKEITDSYEGQQENELFKLLARRRSQTGVDLLSALMKSNLLQKVPTSQVYMAKRMSTNLLQRNEDTRDCCNSEEAKNDRVLLFRSEDT